MRWPAQIPAGQVLNGIASLEDVVPTVMAAAGEPDIKEQLLEGHRAGEKNFRVHLDGYNQLPYFTGESEESARDEFLHERLDDVVAQSMLVRRGSSPCLPSSADRATYGTSSSPWWLAATSPATPIFSEMQTSSRSSITIAAPAWTTRAS